MQIHIYICIYVFISMYIIFLSIYSHFSHLHFRFQIKFWFRQVISSLWTTAGSYVKWRRVSEVMPSNVHHSVFYVSYPRSGYWQQKPLWVDDQLIKIIIFKYLKRNSSKNCKQLFRNSLRRKIIFPQFSMWGS